MKIEDQVCSFEQAKRLDNLGLKLETWCVWYDNLIAQQWFLTDNPDQLGTNIPRIPAYTVAELGVLLGKYQVTYSYDDNMFEIRKCKKLISVVLNIQPNQEGQARGEALIWLISNKNIKIKDLKL